MTEDGGPLGVVPGSHRLPTGPWETLRCSFKSSMTLDATFSQDTMPNHYKFAAPAGTALLFDTACWVGVQPHFIVQYHVELLSSFMMAIAELTILYQCL